MPETMTEPVATETPSAPICATQACKRPLTRLGPPQNCWRCLVCNPIKEVKPTERPKRKYMDVKMTEERVKEIILDHRLNDVPFMSDPMEEKIREIVQDELANWHFQKPPMTRDEIAGTIELTIPTPTLQPKEKNWRQEAKELGIPLHKEPKGSGMRKKIDVLADIEAKQNEASPEGDINDSPVTAEKGA